jgi:hypothetical protein
LEWLAFGQFVVLTRFPSRPCSDGRDLTDFERAGVAVVDPWRT